MDKIRRIPFWKRALDISTIVITAPITVPIAFAISAYIKVVSNSPVIFKQQRVGFGASEFTCYKFRSMKVNAPIYDHENHLKSIIENGLPMNKIDRIDKRLIPGAKFLRATGLDELPQLINIIKGEMSFVGPRPCLKYEFQYFTESHKRRFEVLPGLTGLWQVNGKNKTTFEKMALFDVLYARRYNFFMDLKIMASTFKVLYLQLMNKC